MDDATRSLDNAIEAMKEGRPIENGLGDFVMGMGGIPGGAGQNARFGMSGVNGIETVALNTRGWLISNQRTVLSEMYAEHGLVETVVDVPVNDALRAGYEIATAQLSPEEIAELHSDIEEDGTNQMIAQAMKWVRLYGGGGLIVVTDQPPEVPLDLLALEEDRPLEFVPFDLWELYREGRQAENPGDRAEGEKSRYPFQKEFWDYYGRKVHHTRVITMRGKEAPSIIRPRLQGWGLSVVEPLISSINQYIKARSLTFEVLDEFKLDVYKVEGFKTAMLTKDGTQRILQRFMFANMQKNYQNALVLDKNDDHTGKQLSFTGIADVQKEIRIQAASELRMPMTKLFGLSASGFNSGEDDIEVYNGTVESEVRTPMRPLIVQVVGLKCQQRYGFVPDDLRIKYKPLRILSAKDEEDVKDKKLTRVKLALDSGLMNGEEAVDAMNQEGLVPVSVEYDESLRDAVAADAAAMAGGGGGEGDDGGESEEEDA